MNIFKATGTVLNAAVSVITRACKALENVVEVVELTTEGLVVETRLEQEETLAVGKANLAKLRARLEAEGQIQPEPKAKV